VVTTVHDLQVRPAGLIPRTGHDIHVDLVVTPTRVVSCPRPKDHRPPDVHWDELTEEKIASIPLLGRLAPSR
jgi:5-formyltetrahydrofolate cyclo-ligase